MRKISKEDLKELLTYVSKSSKDTIRDWSWRWEGCPGDFLATKAGMEPADGPHTEFAQKKANELDRILIKRIPKEESDVITTAFELSYPWSSVSFIDLLCGTRENHKLFKVLIKRAIEKYESK